jgi:hypothetical protein
MAMIPTVTLTANINSQINALEIFTPGFEGTFKFRVRAMKGGRILNKHWFYVQTNSQEIPSPVYMYSKQPDDVDSTYGYVLSSSEHVFSMAWTSLNDYREGSFIQFTFRTFRLQGNKHQIYCKTSPNLVSLDHRGVLCMKLDSTNQV